MSTKDLLLQLVEKSDETEKLDFKLDFSLQGSKTEKNELLLDMACIANSYSSDYDNHGFLILGVDADTKEIKGTDLTKEALATHIDERMAKFLSPHIRFSVEFYEIEGTTKRWGAIIIKPGIEMPHVFIADTGEFNKGAVWVRKGSHKCLADPTDFSRFFAIRTESLKKDMDQLEARMNLQENDLKTRIEGLEKKYRNLPKNTAKAPTTKNAQSKETATSVPQPISTNEDEQDLLELVKKELPKRSPLEATLLKEVHEGLIFLESDEIPWSLRIAEANKQEALDVVQKIQSKFENFYRAVFELAFFGDKKEHAELIFNAVQKLAVYLNRGGVPYDALYVRYLPIVTTLYIVSLASIHKGDPTLLKRVIQLTLSNKDRHADKESITDSLFLIRRAQEVFNALHPGYPRTKWCDGVGTYLKQFLSTMLASYEMVQDPEALFYKGEFLITLTPTVTEPDSGYVRGHISAGSYMFHGEAKNILEEFLKKNKDFFEKIFGTKLKATLKNFDEYAPKMGNHGGCWGDGVPVSTTQILFPLAKIVETD